MRRYFFYYICRYITKPNITNYRAEKQIHINMNVQCMPDVLPGITE